MLKMNVLVCQAIADRVHSPPASSRVPNAKQATNYKYLLEILFTIVTKFILVIQLVEEPITVPTRI